LKYALIALIAANVVAFLTFGLDKWLAKRNMRRISERRLLQLTMFLGGIGAFAGSRIFRHKTKKKSFIWRFYLALLINLALFGALLWNLFGLSPGG